MLLIANVVCLVVAILISAGILPAVIRLARTMGAVDTPGGRRSHRGEIPRLGGIGIYLGFVGGVGSALLLTGRVASLGDASSDFPWAGAGIGATIIFAAGLLDDFRQFSPRAKFLFQLLGAGVAVAFGVRIESIAIPFVGTLPFGMASALITLAWILVVTNAMNLIDGLDGLAGGLALIVTSTMAFVSLSMDHFGVLICAVGLAGALAGFLCYNLNPARIFMGDGGSQFLGFVLAILSIRGSTKGATAVALTLPLLVLGVPLLDLSTTILRRALRRAPGDGTVRRSILHRISQADREHLHHNLLDLGWSPGRAVLVLYLIGACFALAGYLSLARSSLPIAVLLLAISVGCVVAIKAAPFLLRWQRRMGPTERP